MSLLGTIRDAVSGLTAAVTARSQTPTGNALQVQIGPGDVISNIPINQPYDHHQVHEGEEWYWSVYANLGNGATKDIELVVPNIDLTGSNAVTKCPHLRWEVISSAGGDAFLYRSPTISVNGASRTPLNLEENGTYTVKMQVREDPTVTAVGTEIWRGLLLAAKNSAGSLDSPSAERVLKNNTKYLFRFTSAGAGNLVLIRLYWYEDLGV